MRDTPRGPSSEASGSPRRLEEAGRESSPVLRHPDLGLLASRTVRE